MYFLSTKLIVQATAVIKTTRNRHGKNHTPLYIFVFWKKYRRYTAVWDCLKVDTCSSTHTVWILISSAVKNNTKDARKQAHRVADRNIKQNELLERNSQDCDLSIEPRKYAIYRDEEAGAEGKRRRSCLRRNVNFSLRIEHAQRVPTKSDGLVLRRLLSATPQDDLCNLMGARCLGENITSRESTSAFLTIISPLAPMLSFTSQSEIEVGEEFSFLWPGFVISGRGGKTILSCLARALSDRCLLFDGQLPPEVCLAHWWKLDGQTGTSEPATKHDSERSKVVRSIIEVKSVGSWKIQREIWSNPTRTCFNTRTWRLFNYLELRLISERVFSLNIEIQIQNPLQWPPTSKTRVRMSG